MMYFISLLELCINVISIYRFNLILTLPCQKFSLVTHYPWNLVYFFFFLFILLFCSHHMLKNFFCAHNDIRIFCSREILEDFSHWPKYHRRYMCVLREQETWSCKWFIFFWLSVMSQKWCFASCKYFRRFSYNGSKITGFTMTIFCHFPHRTCLYHHFLMAFLCIFQFFPPRILLFFCAVCYGGF